MGRAIINSRETDMLGGMRNTVIKWRSVLFTYSSNTNHHSWLIINLRTAIDGMEKVVGSGMKAKRRENKSQESQHEHLHVWGSGGDIEEMDLELLGSLPI